MNTSKLKVKKIECAGLPRAARSDEPDGAIEELSRGELRNQDFSRAIILNIQWIFKIIEPDSV